MFYIWISWIKQTFVNWNENTDGADEVGASLACFCQWKHKRCVAVMWSAVLQRVLLVMDPEAVFLVFQVARSFTHLSNETCNGRSNRERDGEFSIHIAQLISADENRPLRSQSSVLWTRHTARKSRVFYKTWCSGGRRISFTAVTEKSSMCMWPWLSCSFSLFLTPLQSWYWDWQKLPKSRV